MKLSQRTELAIAGALIAYLAFTPGLPVIRDILATGVGKALFLGIVVYVLKYVSHILGILLIVGYVRCASMGREGLENATGDAPLSCGCPGGFTWNPDTKKCINDSGTMRDPDNCTCASGWEWKDKKCQMKAAADVPPPVPEMTTASSTSAPVSTGPMPTGTLPETTPGAANAMVASTPTTSAGPNPVESFISPAQYPF